MQSLQPDPNAQYKGVYEALKRIIKTEGIFRPLRGLNITMMGAGPAHALYFACYERVKHSLSHIIQSGGNSHIANGTSVRVPTHSFPNVRPAAARRRRSKPSRKRAVLLINIQFTIAGSNVRPSREKSHDGSVI